MNTSIHIESPRLLIRTISEGDAAFILRLLNDPAYLEMIRDSGIRDLEAAKKYIRETYIKSYEAHGHGLYLVEEKKRHTSLGIAGFVKREGLTLPDLGFAILSEFAGKGLTQEACQGLLTYGAEKLGFTKVAAITTQSNLGSTKVLTNLGFQFQKKINLPGTLKPYDYYELALKGP